MRRILLLTAVLALSVGTGVVMLGDDPREPTLEASQDGAEVLADLLAEHPTTSLVRERTTSAPEMSTIPPGADAIEIVYQTPEPTTTTSAPARSSNSSSSRESGSGGSSSSNRPSPPTTAAAPPATTTTVKPEFRGGDESDFLSRINGLRSGNDLSSLTRSGSLDSRARDWAKRMSENGQVSHSSMRTPPGSFSAVGENVGRGGSVKSVFDALAASGGHRNNMLGDFTHVGIGVWRDKHGAIWTAHIFAR